MLRSFAPRVRGLFRSFGLFVALIPVSHGVEIDLTRYLLSSDSAGTAVTVSEATFLAEPGSARLSLSGANREATITLNGDRVRLDQSDPTLPSVVVPVSLVERNVISVNGVSRGGDGMVLRIKQIADVQLHVKSRVHFNTNVSDFVAARAFYGKLGFETLTGFPDTNTLAMAQAIGIDTPTVYDGSQGEAAGGYLLHGELIGVGGFRGGLIDLIEFTIPRNDTPPYAALNHLGMARAVLLTTDVARDYKTLNAQGVEFLSDPRQREDGVTFVILRDLDGTFYELREVAGEAESGAATHIVGLGPVNVNVSDFERSRAWYRMLGYELSQRLSPSESPKVAQAMGLTGPFEINGAILHHPEDGSSLELIQWVRPHDPQRAYRLPVNHLGIHRMAFATSDIQADVAQLRAQGG